MLQDWCETLRNMIQKMSVKKKSAGRFSLFNIIYVTDLKLYGHYNWPHDKVYFSSQVIFFSSIGNIGRMAGLLLLTIIIILCFIFRKYGNRLSFVSHLPFLINSTLKVGVYQTAEVTERAFLLTEYLHICISSI